jgi:hypothetical protein
LRGLGQIGLLTKVIQRKECGTAFDLKRSFKLLY